MRIATTASIVLMASGAVALGWVAGQIADGIWFQKRAEARLARVRAALPCGVLESVPPAADATQRSESARIEIPRIEVAAMILGGDDNTSLRRGVGRIPGTADFHEVGNVGLAAHRDTFFRGLRHVAVGDTIRIVTESADHFYVVEWTRIVEPEAIEVLDPTPQRTLTLVTCYPFNYVGSAPQRFIVRARGIPRPPARGHHEMRADGGDWRQSRQLGNSAGLRPHRLTGLS